MNQKLFRIIMLSMLLGAVLSCSFKAVYKQPTCGKNLYPTNIHCTMRKDHQGPHTSDTGYLWPDVALPGTVKNVHQTN